MSLFGKKYGTNALIAGGSEGLGSAFADALAAQGMNLFLVARRIEQLEFTAQKIRNEHSVQVNVIVSDLAKEDSLDTVIKEIGDTEIDFLVYNAAKPYIGKFESLGLAGQTEIVRVNVISPLRFVHYFGSEMVERNRGAIILMSSLSGQQGSPFISVYAATKSFNQVLAEGLWYEWRKKNVDVMACVAGATSTPGFVNSKPKSLGLFEPQVQTPATVVGECFKKLGKTPSLIVGNRNRFATFLMNKLLSRKLAIKVMGSSVKKMYGISD